MPQHSSGDVIQQKGHPLAEMLNLNRFCLLRRLFDRHGHHFSGNLFEG